MVQLLIDNPLLLLFLVCAIGYGVGNIRIKGSRLGIAAVLFVGLGIGAFSPDLKIPDIVFQLGLVIFVYTIGLSNGPGFFASFQGDGRRTLGFLLVILFLPAILTVGLSLLFGIDASVSSGIFAGVSTNTPALSSVLDYITNTAPAATRQGLLADVVVGYSLIYPVGVIGSMLMISLMERVWQIDYAAEAYALRQKYPMAQEMSNRTIQLTQIGDGGIVVRDFMRQHQWNVIFGRMKRADNENLHLVHYDTRLFNGDLLTVVGTAEDLGLLTEVIGEEATVNLSLDSTHYSQSRIFVSNPEVAGEKLATLNLTERYNVIVTRIGRGDTDILATSNAVVELGDRIRIVGNRDDIRELRKEFGDSYHALSEINLLSLGLGITLGLLLGMTTFLLPGDIAFRLGFAGGPLIVALILGALRRTGPIVWTLPYSANLTLRQIGLSFLLAVVGVGSGHTFFTTISESGGGLILLIGTVVTLLSALISLYVGYKWFKIPFSLLIGMISLQPAVIGFGLERAKNQLPNVGYAMTFPIGIISKIVFAQLIYILLAN
ncbi:MAG: aspartate:alanine exchanger family transporter [Anaerolineae bacterium]